MVGRHFLRSIRKMNPKFSTIRELTDLRIAECKTAAHNQLKQFCVEAPDEIDLATIAWHVGRLRIEEGGLEFAEGRIVVPSKNGGTIRVKPGTNNGRKRFT